MPDAFPATPRRFRWLRRSGVWMAVALLAVLGWSGWREYDFRCAVREAKAAGFFFTMSESPVAVIRKDWSAAFRKSTWIGRRQELTFPEGCDLAPFRNLILRLHPTDLDIAYCRHEEVLEEIKGLKKLRLSNSAVLQNARILRGLAGLQQLCLVYCAELQNVDLLRGLTRLQCLQLNNCEELQNVDALRSLTGLQTLDFSGCRALQNVPGLQGLTKLDELDFSYCEALLNMDGLRGLTGLQSLRLNGCESIPVSALRELRAALPSTQITFPDGTTNTP